jgi:hypothetical protein
VGDYSVIKDVGEILKGLLEDISWEDIGKPNIFLKSPKELEKKKGTLISLFLYQIQENTYLKNQEMLQNNTNKLQYPPISLDLFYLIIPYRNEVNSDEDDQDDQDRETEYRMLGKIIQKFYDNSILKGSILKGSLAGTDTELRLILNPISLDDLTKLWTTFPETPYRLSVSYMVTPVKIDSTREIEAKRVLGKETQYYQK